MAAGGLRAVALGAATLLVAVALPPGEAPAQSTGEPPAGVTVRVSVPPGGGQADAASSLASAGGATSRSISADGNIVVFHSAASNYADGTGYKDSQPLHVYARDRAAGTTELVSSDASGVPAGDFDYSGVVGFRVGGAQPAVSADGRYVVFQSGARNLDPELAEPASCWGGLRVYRKDRVTGAVLPVTPGCDSGGPGYDPSISADGNVVTFTSLHWDWERGLRWTDESHPHRVDRLDDHYRLYAFDVRTGAYELLTVDDAGTPGTGTHQTNPRRAHPDATGERVAFISRLSGLAPQADGDSSYVYVRDRPRGTTTLIASTTGVGPLALSDDGNVAAFATADGLADDDPDGGLTDIYVHDLRTGMSERVSQDPDGVMFPPGDGGGGLSLSADGRYVAFVARHRTAGSPMAVWRRDRGDPAHTPPVPPSTIPVSVAPDGEHAPGLFPAITPDGSQVAFTSPAALTPDHTADHDDVFVRDLSDCPTPTAGQDVSAQQHGVACPLISLDGIEVTQAIQNLYNTSRLVTGRRTWVRVHVSSIAGTHQNVTALLRGFVREGGTRGQFIPLSPSRGAPGRPHGFIDVLEALPVPLGGRSQPDRMNLDHSFLFELPEFWTALPGELELQAEVVGHDMRCGGSAPVSSQCSVTVRFDPHVDLDIEVMRVVWRDGSGTVHRPSGGEVLRAVAELQGLLPVRRVRYTILPDFGADGVIGPLTHPGLAMSRLLTVLAAVNKQRTRCPQCLQVGLLVGPPAPAGGVAGIAYLNGGTAAGQGGPALLAFQRDSYTVVHEAGHVLGRPHTQCRVPPEPPPIDATYPSHPHGYLGGASEAGPTVDYGTDVYQVGAAPIIHPKDGKDVMSYCQNKWVSDHTWRRLETGLRARFSRTSGSSTTALADEAVMTVTGVVNEEDGTGEILLFETLQGTQAGTGSGRYALRVQSAQGADLATHPFEPAYPRHGPEGTFHLAVPAHPSAARVTLLRDGVELDARTASANPPTVALISPQGGDRLDGLSTTLRWTAADADGDDLVYRVEYSSDGGATWDALTLNHDRTNLDIDLRSLPGSAQARVRVAATDGFHTTTATSGAFTVADRLPEVGIEKPVGEGLFSEAQPLLLHGFAYDNEDGLLAGPALAWSSDVDGPLGLGEDLAVAGGELTPGRHTVTLTATDSSGNRAMASLQIEILPGSLACPYGVPSAGFADTARNTHLASIDCAVWHGLAQGRTDTIYAPAEGVTRGQMASFLARLVEGSGTGLPTPQADTFTDIASSVHRDRINQLAAAGIVRGTTDTTYSPSAGVRRDQMATFLVRAYEHLAGQPLPAPPSGFADIAGNPHADSIDKAAGAGFARGTTPETYAPSAGVRRDQMATFLTRLLDRLAADGPLR